MIFTTEPFCVFCTSAYFIVAGDELAQQMWGGQRTAWGGWLSPSSMWGLRMDVASPGLETTHLLPEPFPGVDGYCFLMLTEMARPFCGMVHSLPKGAPPAEHLHPALFSECVLNVTQLLQGPAAPTFLPRWVETWTGSKPTPFLSWVGPVTVLCHSRKKWQRHRGLLGSIGICSQVHIRLC